MVGGYEIQLIKTPLPHLLNWSYGHDAPAFLSSA
jgi:hypothetical protein